MQPILYILGDVHYPGDDAEPNAILPFLDGLQRRPPARLVILGDLFEYWLNTTQSLRRNARLCSALRQLAAAGWRLDLIPGNREMGAEAVLYQAIGAQRHWPVLDLQLGRRRIRITHGEFLCDDPGHRLLDTTLRCFWSRGMRAAMPSPVQEWVAGRMRRHSRGHGRYRLRHELPLPNFDLRRVCAAARGVEVLVCGHVHVRLHRQLGGSEFYVVGDWTRQSGSWLQGYADGRLQACAECFPLPQEVAACTT